MNTMISLSVCIGVRLAPTDRIPPKKTLQGGSPDGSPLEAEIVLKCVEVLSGGLSSVAMHVLPFSAWCIL